MKRLPFVESWVYLGHSHYAAQAPHISTGDWRKHTEQWQDRLAALWRQLRVSKQGLLVGPDLDPS